MYVCMYVCMYGDGCMYVLYIYSHTYTVTTFKYVEGGPEREALEVVWNTSSYI